MQNSFEILGTLLDCLQMMVINANDDDMTLIDDDGDGDNEGYDVIDCKF